MATSFIDAVKAFKQKKEQPPHQAATDPFDSPAAPADPFDAPAAPSGPAGGGDRAAGYAAAALDRELDAVRTAPEGTRNDTLNKAAFNLGQLVAGGELDEATVVTVLTDAARSAGLTEKEIGKTINSGLSKGRLNPRTAPRERILGGVYENPEQAAASWTEPEPIVDNGDPPGPFPVDALPGTVREFVTALAEHTQTPVDMPAMTALSALSVVAANRVWITGGSGWVEPLVDRPGDLGG